MKKTIVIVMSFVSLLTACGHTPSVEKTVAPLTYKIDLQQGNVVTQEMVAKLHQGMTQPQVRYVMGSPLVMDPFHPDRWDYVYTYEKGHKVTERHRLTVVFADGKLARLEGDIEIQDTLPPADSAAETPATVGTPAPAATPAAMTPAPPAATDAAAPAQSQPQATGVTAPAAAATTAPAQPAAVEATAPAATQPATAVSPAAVTPDAAQTPAAALPAGGTATNAAATTDKPTAEADATKTGDSQKPKQRGFFGRMLDKIGL
ncbi:MAG TPA: outer membrane protein assembly factor BamE [Burkholderiales bacterium]|nr:outer membrane protein assembly factor BamE [Burkholderiales bacterium]